MNRLISDHIRLYIDDRKKEGWTVIEDAEEVLSTKDLSCVTAVYDMNPDTVQFGQLYAFYAYAEGTEEEACYKLDWCIRRKWNTRPELSNRPVNIHEIRVAKFHEVRFADTVDTNRGSEAFLMYTPTKSLTGFNRDLRKSMLAIRRFVAENRLCRKIRELEKEQTRT